jgi:hypothetical protein
MPQSTNLERIPDTHDREHIIYNSFTLYRGLCPVLTHSDFITNQVTREPPLSLLTLPLVYDLEITTCRYKDLL